MRSENKNNRRPLTPEELSTLEQDSGVVSLDKIFAKVLRDVPLEKRRKEAEEPLYLVRYE